MEFIEVITNYLKDAPLFELRKVDIIIGERLRPVPVIQINPAVVEQAIISKCQSMWDGTNKLVIVKFFKKMTGMGLSEAKDWCDYNIFINKALE